MKKAVVSFSGGLDSTTCLCWAISKGFNICAVSFDYGQRHKKEIYAAKKIASVLNVKLIEIKLNLPWLNVSSLVDKKKEIPNASIKEIISKDRIPSTYVPVRNLIFASLLVSYAESHNFDYVVMGPNAIDFSGYPDCRPVFYKYLNMAVKYGTKNGKIKILTPIINMSKKEIIKLALKLKAPIQYSWSCYRGDKKPCGICDACKIRKKAFEELNIKDPAYE
ncbi:MAG: 7-cyano-7-deazaguanine synthase QueC [Elusimicrobiales bacterium]|nr:7-cyano-7-deazaguanine synthase QueC [Elusimicrobiales bacterium]